MAEIDLTSVEWRELIFQGKNKEYGAYKMRSDSDKRHNKAMLIIVLVVGVGMCLPRLINLVQPKQHEVHDQVYEFIDKPIVDEVVKPAQKVAPPPDLRPTLKFTRPVIKPDILVNEKNLLKPQDEVNNTNILISKADIVGTPGGTTEIDLKGDLTGIREDNTIYTGGNIEQMPEFPGGEQELLKYIGNNLRYPAISQEMGVQGKVILRFVVSKTGKVDKVEVLRSLDSACDEEAIRVVKLLPRFIPGKQNGINVAVWFTLPITYKSDIPQ